MSKQQDIYLAARAEGLSASDAGFEAGFDAPEIKLIEQAIARGELQLPSPPQIQGPNAGGGSEPAHAAGNREPGADLGSSIIHPGCLRTPATPRKEDQMGRPKKNEEQESTEIKQPDFERMKKVFLNDIKPAEEKNAKSRGDLSAAWKVIEDDCGLNKKAAKLLHKLNNESEETRDDFLRTLYGGMKALGLGISEDLVDQMEDSDAPEMPVKKTRGLGADSLATLN